MRKANTALAVILALLVGAGMYFVFGTRIRAEATATRSGDVLTVDIALGNGSLFPYEYLEFIAAPDPGILAGSVGAGEDVKILSERAAQVTLNLPEGQGCTLEIGYYVLGVRKTVTLSIQ